MADINSFMPVAPTRAQNALGNPFYMALADPLGAALPKAEDAGHASGDYGFFALAVRNDANAVLTSADLDYSAFAVDSAGRMKVVGSFLTGAEKTEDAASANADTGMFFLGVRNDASAALTSADGDYGGIAIDSAGRMKVVAELVTPGTAAGNLGKAEDAPHASADTGVFVLAVRSDAYATTFTSADGDYSPIAVDLKGRVGVDLAAQTLTAVKVSKDGNANAESNPLYVTLVNIVSANEVQDYKTAAALASAATDNHDYTSVATTFLLSRVRATASGAIKVVVSVGPVAGLVVKDVAFSSMANPNIDMVFDPPLEVPTTSTGTTRVAVTNRELVAMDVYSTIYGRQT